VNSKYGLDKLLLRRVRSDGLFGLSVGLPWRGLENPSELENVFVNPVS
jgi:hypothetical protein